jgi:hypothetical protein
MTSLPARSAIVRTNFSPSLVQQSAYRRQRFLRSNPLEAGGFRAAKSMKRALWRWQPAALPGSIPELFNLNSFE